jgi:tetratricopeptide (TPR) repeat protein
MFPSSRFFHTIVAWLGLSLSIAVAQSGSAPGDLYFDGFQAWKTGEKLEQDGNKQAALQKYLEAQKSIQAVSQTYPEWQPDVVIYRLKNVEQALTRLGYTLPASSNAAPAAPLPGPATVPFTPVPGAPGTVPVPAPAGSPSSITGLIDQQFQALQQQNAGMAEKLRLYQDGYTNALKDRQKAETDRDLYITQMQALNKRLDQLTKDTNAKDAAAQAEILKLRNESKMVSDMLASRAKQFEDSAKAIESLKTERDALLASQKQLQEDLAKAKSTANAYANVPGDMGKLMAENVRLKTELETARKQVETLKAEGGKKDEEIASLKTQITGIQKQIVELRKENTDYQTQVAELTVKLKDMNSDLQKPGPKKPDSKLAKENETLRAIIMRHLRQQQRALTAKELAIAEMKKLEITSQTLMENLEDLTSGKVRITVDEEALFTEPELKIIIASKGGANATLEANSTKAKSGASKGGASAPTPAVAPIQNHPSGSPTAPALASSSTKSSMTPEEKLMVRAEQALQSQDYKAAERDLQDVLRANPKNIDALIGLAGIKRTDQKQAEAEVLLQKCLVYEPTNASALYWLGVCQFQQNRLPDALASFDKCVESDKKNAKAHHYLGIISNTMSNRRRAEAEFKSALAIDPDYADAYFNLAVLYATSSPPDFDKAREHYHNALRRGIHSDPALEKLLDLKVQKSEGSAPTAAKAPDKTALR